MGAAESVVPLVHSKRPYGRKWHILCTDGRTLCGLAERDDSERRHELMMHPDDVCERCKERTVRYKGGTK